MEVFSNQEQLRLFLQSILLGVGIGVVYDLLRAPRRVFGFGWAATAVCDALFWLVLLAALFEFNLLFAMGQSRYFVLAGVAGGAALYFQLISAVVLAVLEGVLQGIVRLIAGLCWLGRSIRQRWRQSPLVGKIRFFAKKFAKPSSIFRGKGIK